MVEKFSLSPIYGAMHFIHWYIYLLSNVRNGSSWSWSYGSWIYNYLCNQCLSLLSRRGVLVTLCYKVVSDFQQVVGFLQVLPISSTNKTDHHNMTEILLKVALNTINPKPTCIYIYVPSKTAKTLTPYILYIGAVMVENISLSTKWFWNYIACLQTLWTKCMVLHFIH